MVLGTTRGSVCPVASILNYMANARPAGSASSGSFFIFSNGRALTRDRFVRELREALVIKGI